MTVGIQIVAHLSRTEKGQRPKGLCGVTGAGRLRTCKFFTVSWYLEYRRTGKSHIFGKPLRVCQECVSLITGVEELQAADL